MKPLLILVGVLALGGCVAPEEPVRGDCGAEGMQDLLGKDKAVFAAMTFPTGTRFIAPGMAITEDFRPDRLNFDISERGRITGIWCG